MNNAANLADQNMQNMLSFIMKIMKKSLYASFSTFISVRKF